MCKSCDKKKKLEYWVEGNKICRSCYGRWIYRTRPERRKSQRKVNEAYIVAHRREVSAKALAYYHKRSKEDPSYLNKLAAKRRKTVDKS